MKKLLLLSALLISAITFAQVPQGISYQAIALNGSGNPVVSANVGVRLSVLDNSASGTVLYTETHVKTTTAQGLFNLVIGQGTAVTGTFSSINWGTNSKFLKVEMDVAGGTNYATVGTTQLLSVPYAMYAGNTAAVSPASLNGIGTSGLKSSAFVVVDGSSVKGFYNGTWSSQTFSDYVYASDVQASGGNFVIVDGSSVKGFAKGVWSTQAFSDYVYASDVIASNGAFTVVDGSSVKGFFNGVWSNQVFSDYVYASDVIASNGAFVIVDGASVKGFYNGVWSTQTFSDYVYASNIQESNGNFIIVDGSSVKSFSKGVWATQTFSDYIYASDVIASPVD